MSAAKRLFDIALASAGLIASAPVLAVSIVAIKLDSAGPALFRQKRVGRGRRVIETFKLRTMVTDAGSGSTITAHRDPRVTRVGRWLRRTKLDELPQLWNVLRGDMSLVGPRPEVPQFVELYRPEWQKLLEVRPGLTDLASITFRDEQHLLAHARDHERAYREIIMPLKLSLALEDMEQSSVRHDIEILARTVFSILGGRSPRQAQVVTEAQRRIAELDNTGRP